MLYGFDGYPKTFRIFGGLSESLMRSRLDVENDVVINLFADEQAAR